MKKLLRFAAVAATGLGLVAPAMVSAQTATGGTQGPNSKVTVKQYNKNRFNSDVKNNVKFNAKNTQTSTTGDAKAKNNTTVGDVGSGSASADATTHAAVTLDNSNANSACGCVEGADQNADATTEGPNSPVYIKQDNDNKVTITTDNKVDIKTDNKQTARSGDATAYNNTTVGNVTTGDATATNDTMVELNITN